jgi:hypothetical protein
MSVTTRSRCLLSITKVAPCYPHRPARPARRLRHLAVLRRPRPAGPAPGHRAAPGRPLRPPPPGQRPRPRRHAPAPLTGPARHLHRSRLPQTRRSLRLRTQHPVRSRRPDLPVQRKPEMPPRPPAQARPPLERRATAQRRGPVDHTLRTAVHHRTHAVPHLGSPGAGPLTSPTIRRAASRRRKYLGYDRT